jgi:hypothetical protein
MPPPKGARVLDGYTGKVQVQSLTQALPALPYFYCFDRQEAKMQSLEAHDGGMSQDFCIDEQD